MQNYQFKGFWNCWISLLIIHFSCFISPPHPFYLSVTELKYNQESKKMEISVKLFTDDFEKTLHNIHKIPIDLLHPKDQEATEKLVEEYISKHLSIQCDSKLLQMTFIGYEKENDAIWSYFESEALNAPKSIAITNTLLYQFIKGQMNIMHVNIGSEKKSYKLNNPDANAVFAF